MDAVGDFGLLEPGRVGSSVEAATSDAAYVRAMLAAEVGLARAQASLGMVPEAAADAIAEAAESGDFGTRDLAERARSGGNPVIPLVEDLRALVPDAAAYVHLGATSQDILDTAAMLVAAQALDLITADLDLTITALGRLAAAHRDTAMAGRTLTQHAVPTTFGLKAAGWRSLVIAARDRIGDVRAVLPVQLGGAAGTLAAFEGVVRPSVALGGGRREPDAGVRQYTDRGPESPPNQPLPAEARAEAEARAGAEAALALPAAFATHLNLAAPDLPWHVLRIPIADLAAALAVTAGALGKLAADVLTLSRTEIAELSEGVGGGSSSMPHKANPVRATLIAATARQIPHLAAILFASMTAEDERPAGAWHAEWQPLRQALRLVGGAARDAAELVDGLQVHSGRMAANLAVTGHLTDPIPASAGELVDRALRTKAKDQQ